MSSRLKVLWLAGLSFLVGIVPTGCRNTRTVSPPLPQVKSQWTRQAEIQLASRKLPSNLAEATPQSLKALLFDDQFTSGDLRSFMELAYKKADELDDKDIQLGVEMYAYAACFAWRFLEWEGTQNPNSKRVMEVYQSCLMRVLLDGEKGKKFELSERWQVSEKVPPFPIASHGFPNRASLFRNLTVPMPDKNSMLTNYYIRKGAGLPVIFHPDAGEWQKDPLDIYHGLGHPFSATVLIVPDPSQEGCFCRLDVINPRKYANVRAGKTEVTLAADFSAPYEEMLERDLASKLWILGFLDGDRESKFQGLYMVDPYQPGKIPVVFVHGLLSSPATWMEALNELSQDQNLRERYQFWLYMYPTSGSILLNGTDLRENLYKAIAQVDPKGEDQALKHMVLVGHSMGGLLSKLQVTHSDNRMYKGLCNIPFEELRGRDTTLALAKKTMFFEPNPNIRHVVYVGTPHDGSPISLRPSGRVGSWLAKVPSWQKNFRQDLVESNPNVFQSAFRIQGQPNSIDMLGLENPFLRLFQTLRTSKNTKVHTIAGDMNQFFEFNRGDGVVPVKSALAVHSDSMITIPESHMHIHHHPQAIAEIAKVLKENLAEAELTMLKPAQQ